MWDRHLIGGTVADLHQRDIPLDRRAVWVMAPTVPTLVEGSAQSLGLVPPSESLAAGWSTTRRRSGGGLVALDPNEVMWVDVVIPQTDELWSDDVTESFRWLGEVWVRALRSLGIQSDVHVGPSVRASAGRAVCFAGIGSGEVTVDGAKLVGISQRRTRHGARFQCLVHRRWQPDRWWPLVSRRLNEELADSIDPVLYDGVTSLARELDGTEAVSIDHVDELLLAAVMSELMQLSPTQPHREASLSNH